MNAKKELSSCPPWAWVSPRPQNSGCSYPEWTGDVEAGGSEARKQSQL